MHLAGRLSAEAGEVAVAYIAVRFFKRTSARAARRPALRAAGWFVEQAFVGVDPLFTSGERELRASLAAQNRLCGVGQTLTSSCAYLPHARSLITVPDV